MNLNELVEQYISLRDTKAKHKAEYEGKVKAIDEVLAKMEAVLLKTFHESGLDSVKTKAGTAYRSTRTSATVADWDTFFDHYVKPNEAWELLEHRCNKSAVEQHKEARGELPPGINWREEQVVNVRRS